MKNYEKEEIVTDIRKLANDSYKIVESIAEKLNENKCPTLNDLFVSKQNDHVFKQKDIIEKYKITNKGLYVLGEKESNMIKPVYVGISRDITTRLKQHGWGKSHNQASLAYLIATHSYKGNYILPKPRFQFQVASKTKRKYLNWNDQDFIEAKNLVRDYYVVTYPMENDYELYFHEIAVACILETYWNSFRTH